MLQQLTSKHVRSKCHSSYTSTRSWRLLQLRYPIPKRSLDVLWGEGGRLSSLTHTRHGDDIRLLIFFTKYFNIILRDRLNTAKMIKCVYVTGWRSTFWLMTRWSMANWYHKLWYQSFMSHCAYSMKYASAVKPTWQVSLVHTDYVLIRPTVVWGNTALVKLARTTVNHFLQYRRFSYQLRDVS